MIAWRYVNTKNIKKMQCTMVNITADENMAQGDRGRATVISHALLTLQWRGSHIQRLPSASQGLSRTPSDGQAALFVQGMQDTGGQQAGLSSCEATALKVSWQL